VCGRVGRRRPYYAAFPARGVASRGAGGELATGILVWVGFRRGRAGARRGVDTPPSVVV